MHQTELVAQNISHEKRDSTFEAAKLALITKVQKRGDLPHVSVARQLELIEELSCFELGQFLIERGGLNGYWTNYIISHPAKARASNCNRFGSPFHPLESFLLNRAPVCLATQQRFVIFKAEIQRYICEGCSFASVPSGLMADLLDLDYSGISSFSLYGIDLDPETLLSAKTNAENRQLRQHCYFSQKNCWDLGFSEHFDLITSNGLTIYEPGDSKVVALYGQFYQALVPGGVLVTSFLTPPPIPGQSAFWVVERVNLQDVLLQKILLADILQIKWQIYRTEEQVKSLLQQAGFNEITIIYDEAHIFPTVVAKKPG